MCVGWLPRCSKIEEYKQNDDGEKVHWWLVEEPYWFKASFFAQNYISLYKFTPCLYLDIFINLLYVSIFENEY